MLLILTNSFLKKEFKPLKKYYSINDIAKTALKAKIKPDSLSPLGYKNGRLLKLRVTNKASGRMAVYAFTGNNWIIPIVLRLKKDKIFGENLAINNKKAKNLILKMLDLAMDDIEKKNYIKIELNKKYQK